MTCINVATQIQKKKHLILEINYLLSIWNSAFWTIYRILKKKIFMLFFSFRLFTKQIWSGWKGVDGPPRTVWMSSRLSMHRPFSMIGCTASTQAPSSSPVWLTFQPSSCPSKTQTTSVMWVLTSDHEFYQINMKALSSSYAYKEIMFCVFLFNRGNIGRFGTKKSSSFTSHLTFLLMSWPRPMLSLSAMWVGVKFLAIKMTSSVHIEMFSGLKFIYLSVIYLCFCSV